MKRVCHLIPMLLFFIFQSQAQDTARIKLGGKTLIIVDMPDKNDTLVQQKDTSGCEDCVEKPDPKISHWTGIDFGLCQMTDTRSSLNIANSLYDIDPGKSYGLGLNLASEKLVLFKGYLGIISGLGLDFVSYNFRSNATLYSDNELTELRPVTDMVFIRNKLNVTYAKVPLLIELNSSLLNSKSFHLGFGAEGGVKLGSFTKQKFEIDSHNNKNKIRNDYNLNLFKLNYLAYFGYRSITIFGRYSGNPLFEKGKGPTLYPYQVGLRIVM